MAAPVLCPRSWDRPAAPSKDFSDEGSQSGHLFALGRKGNQHDEAYRVQRTRCAVPPARET